MRRNLINIYYLIPLLWFAIYYLACSGGSGGGLKETPSEDQISTIIGSKGGTIITPSGNATLIIPTGALTDDTTITIAESRSDNLLGTITEIYDFSPDGLTFDIPVTITLKYDPTSLPEGCNESNLKLAYASGEQWIIINDSSVDTTSYIVTGQTSHFSPFSSKEERQPLNKNLGEFNRIIAYSNNHGDPTPTTDPYYNSGDPHYLKNNGLQHDECGHATGEEWQCVEYISRYYWKVYRHNILLEAGQNDASNFWNTAEERGLERYANKGDVSPKIGDIVVFKNNETGWGHVAIIREISDTEIRVIQQNWYLTNLDSYAPLNYRKDKNYLETFNDDKNLYKVLGWLRLPSSNDTIDNFAHDISDAHNNNDPCLYTFRTSTQYLNAGLDYNDRTKYLSWWFDTFTSSDFSNTITEVISNDSTFAEINMSYSYKSTSKETGCVTDWNNSNLFPIIFENEKWRFYGDHEPELQESSIINAVSCKSFEYDEQSCRNYPIGITSEFSGFRGSESRIYVYIVLKDLIGNVPIETQWHSPNVLIKKDTRVLESNIDFGYRYTYIWSYISGDEIFWNYNAGKWNVYIYVDGILKKTITFSYTP